MFHRAPQICHVSGGHGFLLHFNSGATGDALGDATAGKTVARLTSGAQVDWIDHLLQILRREGVFGNGGSVSLVRKGTSESVCKMA
jgi:hypothetical protein